MHELMTCDSFNQAGAAKGPPPAALATPPGAATDPRRSPGGHSPPPGPPTPHRPPSSGWIDGCPPMIACKLAELDAAIAENARLVAKLRNGGTGR
ncbi:MAG TPA: hypothetical protein VMW52_02040 [Phycisphaerae bacterium]|nr:hypothetical protein [Phycisphaerae bacterium]